VLTTSAAAAQEPQAARTAGYPFLIVLSLADRNLNTALTHDHVAGNDFPQIRMIMSHLAHALDNLHSEERIHADFKPLNAARELTWKLIDMDVSRKFDEPFGTKLPSSGYCPPEMAKVLLALRNAETDEVKTQELAKYTASVAYDLWSFGVVLFHLCYGISLFNTDQNDNVSLRDLSSLAGWTPRLLNLKIKDANKHSTPDFNAAADLIKKLLVSDPEERCKPFDEGCEMSSVLKHPFFQVGGEGQEQLNRIEEHAVAASKHAAAASKHAAAAAENTFKLIEMGEEHQSELQRTRKVLLKAVFEATARCRRRPPSSSSRRSFRMTTRKRRSRC
jgi:serine/threonine protein kinase